MFDTADLFVAPRCRRVHNLTRMLDPGFGLYMHPDFTPWDTFLLRRYIIFEPAIQNMQRSADNIAFGLTRSVRNPQFWQNMHTI
jgi:hypothetical protein